MQILIKPGKQLLGAAGGAAPELSFAHTIGLFDIFLILAIIVLLAALLKMYFSARKVRLTDEESGMGNLSYFKKHFAREVAGNKGYYLGYIILDSRYLRSYYSGVAYKDVICFAAGVFRENTGEKEFSARITESGFAICFKAENDEEAAIRMDYIIGKLSCLEKEKISYKPSLFCGAVYRLSVADKDLEHLVFNLRRNCNEIFGTGKKMVICDEKMMNRIRDEKENTDRILNGLQKDEFKLYLQFIVDNKTKEIVSAEALSRWDNPEKGLVGPGGYIQNMEKSGLISKHDFYMFENVCRQLAAWKGTPFGHISISCNFTRITLSETNFVDKILAIANKYDFDREKLAIEITEDSIEKNREMASENVKACKEMGFRIYLDDLGSGYTAFANLGDYFIDIVKIDRDILLKTDTERGKALFQGIVALAHNLDMKVICEGVETEEQNEFVSASSCDFVQGWYYSIAIPSKEWEPFLEKYAKMSAEK